MIFDDDTEPEQRETKKFVGVLLTGFVVILALVIALVWKLLKG